MREGDSWFDKRVSPSFLLSAGLLLVPAIILQQNLVVKAVQTALFLLLALRSVAKGRRRLILGSLVFIMTTIIVNQFSPFGQVLLRVGPLRITRGALYVGISKATTLASLVYVSRWCVRPSVRLPGIPGQYVSLALDYLDKLLARRERVVRHNLVQRLDDIFDSILREGENKHPDSDSLNAANTVPGLIALAALLIVNWAAVFFPFSSLLGTL